MYSLGSRNWGFFLPGFDWMTVHYFVEYVVVGRFLAISETSVYILYKSINIYKSNVLWWGRSFPTRKLILPDIFLSTPPPPLYLQPRGCISLMTQILPLLSVTLYWIEEKQNSDMSTLHAYLFFCKLFLNFVLFSLSMAWQKGVAVFCLGNEKVLEIDGGDGYTIL